MYNSGPKFPNEWSFLDRFAQKRSKTNSRKKDSGPHCRRLLYMAARLGCHFCNQGEAGICYFEDL